MDSRGFQICLMLFGTLLTGACSTPEYRYIPTTHQANDGERRNEAIYLIPQHAPAGTLRLLSLGVVEVRPKEKDSKRIPAFHMQMIVSNHSFKQIWSVNTQEQLVFFPAQGGQAVPLFVNSESKNIVDIDIPAGDARTLDFYYALPTPEKSAQDLPQFDFKWTILAGDQLVTDITPFDRVPVREHPPVVYPYVGFGAVF